MQLSFMSELTISTWIFNVLREIGILRSSERPDIHYTNIAIASDRQLINKENIFPPNSSCQAFFS